MAITPLAASAPDVVFDFLDTKVSARGRAHWRWKYQLDSGKSGRAFYHTGADGSVGGFIGIMPTTLHDHDRTATAAWFVDWATAPGEGSVGAGVGLLRRAEAATEVLLTLQGSADTQRILPKLRWQSVATPAMWVRPVSARGIGVRGPARRHAWLQPLGLLAGALGRLYFRVREPVGSGLGLREVERFPASYDAVWAARASEFAPLMERSSAALNFMCADFPGDGYRRFLVLVEGQVAGHLVVRVDEKNDRIRGRIVDLLWPRNAPGMLRWLVLRACWVLQECGVDYIECTASARDLEQALGACHFRRRQAVPIWYHRLPVGIAPPDSWYVTFLDCDRAYR